jgi:RNA polymerase sigma-70 factor (ECF subfamily)
MPLKVSRTPLDNERHLKRAEGLLAEEFRRAGPKWLIRLIDALPPSGRVKLAHRLRYLHYSASATWSGVDFDASEFVAELAPRLERTSDLFHALHSAHTSDLYLALACLRGNVRALAHLDRAFLQRKSRTSADDEMGGTQLEQAVRAHILTIRSDKPPPLAGYRRGSGRDPNRARRSPCHGSEPPQSILR